MLKFFTRLIARSARLTAVIVWFFLRLSRPVVKCQQAKGVKIS